MSEPVVREYPFQISDETRDGDGLTLEGYAAVFNSPTEINSWEGKFTEVIAPGAFKRSIDHKMPVLQFDHGHHPMIGGLPIGRISSLAEDNRGLRVRAKLSDNWLIHPVRDAIKDGAVTGMSFRFSVIKDEWEDDVRTLREVAVHELGPVVFPAYTQTSVGVRSADDPLAQLVDLLRSNPDLRDPLARMLAFGTSETPAEPGTVTEPAEEETETPVEAEVVDDGLRERLLDAADSIDRRLAVFLRR